LINTDPTILDKLESALHPKKNGEFSLFMKKAQKSFLLLGLSIVVAIFFLYNGLNSFKGVSQQESLVQAQSEIQPETHQPLNEIYVDLSGSVNKPRTYRIPRGTRLFELLELAGGLSPEADKGFVQRNYNFAVVLNDQQKVHIPSIYEVHDGKFSERNKLVTLESNLNGSANSQSASTNTVANSSLISLNNSSLEELKVLPGVGDVIGQQIMAARPYSQVSDLITKGIVKQTLYDKIARMLEP
jgi:competence protein ComEA